MTRVGVRELKAHLGSYLAQVRRGTPLLITDRGVPVARLEALDDAPVPMALRTLVERGVLRYRRPGGPPTPPPLPLTPGDRTAVDFVLDQRR